MKFSPTTILAYLRLVAFAAIAGHIIFTIFVHGVYAIDTNTGLAYMAAAALVDKLLGIVQGHFTADSPPGPKSDDTNKIQP